MKIRLLSLVALLFSTLGLAAQRLEVVLPSGLAQPGAVSLRAYPTGEQVALPATSPMGDSAVYQSGALAAGMYELVVGTYNPLPFVIYGQNKLVSRPGLAQLQGHAVAGSDPENQALAAFLGPYYSWQNRQKQLEETARKDGKTGMTVFMSEFIRYHNQLNETMDTLVQHYPNSYMARYLASLYGTRFTPADSLDAMYRQLHQHYADSWNLSEPMALNNPVLMSELNTYFRYFGSRQGTFYSAMATLLKRPDVQKNQVVRDRLIDMISQMLLTNHYPKGEEYALYMAETYGETCGTTAEKQANPNSIIDRLKRTQVGAHFPAFTFSVLGQTDSVQVASLTGQQPYTLVYIWQSSCPRCKALTPEVEAFATENAHDLQTVAIAIDAEADKARLVDYLTDRKPVRPNQARHWTDCWEPANRADAQLRQLYISSTPFFVLLNANGDILARSGSLEVINDTLKTTGRNQLAEKHPVTPIREDSVEKTIR